jgi:hypothetical protein
MVRRGALEAENAVETTFNVFVQSRSKIENGAVLRAAVELSEGLDQGLTHFLDSLDPFDPKCSADCDRWTDERTGSDITDS